MAEEVKAKRRPVDKNSAKYKLGEIAKKAYSEATEAKARGEMIGWCASNFPVEIPETLGLHVVYPENQAAGIAARGAGERMCNISEEDGYSNDICAYARVSLAYAKTGDCPEQDMPQPDFVLCCNNICNVMIKWYENIAREKGIPMFLIDVPYNNEYDVTDDKVEYIKEQFWDVIHGLEEYTGKKWSDEKFKEVAAISRRSSEAWLKACKTARYNPSPFNGFVLLNHMAVMVTARGKIEAAEAMEQLNIEWEENHEKGISTFRTEEKARIMFEGIACWPWLRVTATGLKDRGMNMVATIYADAFGFIYDDLDGLCRAYASVPNSVSLEKARDKRVNMCKEIGVEGVLVHTNRSCKLWSGFMPEMSRQISEQCNIPVVSFDGDQADPRNFSEAQYDTRVQGLSELIEARKGSE
jgi:benzoyl-CoA reductase/2-hydroxyglutaryl-CoA dehydratase subunit BcrC/BadD/HgdB